MLMRAYMQLKGCMFKSYQSVLVTGAADHHDSITSLDRSQDGHGTSQKPGLLFLIVGFPDVLRRGLAIARAAQFPC